jgi:hypothetical protein
LSTKGIRIWKPAVNVALYFPSRSTMTAVRCGITLTIDEISIKASKIIPIRINVVLEAEAANVVKTVMFIDLLVLQII